MFTGACPARKWVKSAAVAVLATDRFVGRINYVEFKRGWGPKTYFDNLDSTTAYTNFYLFLIHNSKCSHQTLSIQWINGNSGKSHGIKQSFSNVISAKFGIGSQSISVSAIYFKGSLKKLNNHTKTKQKTAQN